MHQLHETARTRFHGGEADILGRDAAGGEGVGQALGAGEGEGKRGAVAEAADQQFRIAARGGETAQGGGLAEGQDGGAGLEGERHWRAVGRQRWGGGFRRGRGGGGCCGELVAGHVGCGRRGGGEFQPGQRAGRGRGDARRVVVYARVDGGLRFRGIRRRGGRHIGEVWVGQVRTRRGLPLLRNRATFDAMVYANRNRTSRQDRCQDKCQHDRQCSI